MTQFEENMDALPEFVSYFARVHRAMQHFGGSATPQQVHANLAEHDQRGANGMEQASRSGPSGIENRADWARFYLTKAGWMYAPKRGVWGLTDKGMAVQEMTHEQAIAVYASIQSPYKGGEDSQEAPQDGLDSDDTQYWFVGAMWGIDDQMPRFLQAGIWQNGYEEKFSDQVRAMKPGDRIAIKAAYVRKYDVPFDAKGQRVSTMKIKARGTVTRNHGDGRTVDVQWELNPEPQDWYLYTYRGTVTKARVAEDEQARQLVKFAFEGKGQNYAYFLAQPYWRERFSTPDAEHTPQLDDQNDVDETIELGTAEFYGVEDVVAEGCFVSAAELGEMLKRWKSKKNLILQGPPGTGKTWLAKRLAKALIGQKQISDEQLRVVQFHPALSYEDFVRGYRPGGDGRLMLTDGVFLQVVQAAIAQPDVEHVLIIEEINRGNPAQVLGEMLTLLESSKRSSADAMELAYSKVRGEKVYVPENLYVIGTMNVADRSLALVDLALRRRFAFVGLMPSLNAAWQQWCSSKGMDFAAIAHIQTRMEALNQEIADDRALGSQFQIGHSYVTPHEPVPEATAWFADVVRSEIGPLLHEYWFDAPEQAEKAIERLLQAA